jgi:acyl-CoA synthetase (AMP-forming)/AMP-acid ligase II
MIFESPDPIPSTLPPSGRIVYDHVLPEKTAFDPNSPAFIDGITGRIITRAELRRDTLRLGQGIHELKSRGAGREGKEPVVLIFSPNTMDYPVQFLGVQAAGCIASLVNASYLTDELAHQIRDGTPFLIFILDFLGRHLVGQGRQASLPELPDPLRKVDEQYSSGVRPSRDVSTGDR